MTQAPDLKPCPFCGGEAKITDAEEAGPQAYVVSCTKCLCSSKVIFALKDDVTFDLERAWNRRADLCPDAATVRAEALREAAGVAAARYNADNSTALDKRNCGLPDNHWAGGASASEHIEREILALIDTPAPVSPQEAAIQKAADKAVFGYMSRDDRYAEGVLAGVYRMRRALAEQEQTDG